MNDRTYTVYKGEKGGRIVYIGTTIQKPEDRFRWHKANGKPLKFTVLSQYETSDEMIDEEYRLIKLHKPCMNKIKNRPQNLNVELSQDVLDSRKGSSEWCQCCLRRRTNVGYSKCYWCYKNKKTAP